RRVRAARAAARASPSRAAPFGATSAAPSSEQLPAPRRAGGELHAAFVLAGDGDVDAQVGPRQQAFCLLRPFRELEARFGEHGAKVGVFPFLRVVEAVEVEEP